MKNKTQSSDYEMQCIRGEGSGVCKANKKNLKELQMSSNTIMRDVSVVPLYVCSLLSREYFLMKHAYQLTKQTLTLIDNLTV